MLACANLLIMKDMQKLPLSCACTTESSKQLWNAPATTNVLEKGLAADNLLYTDVLNCYEHTLSIALQCTVMKCTEMHVF